MSDRMGYVFEMAKKYGRVMMEKVVDKAFGESVFMLSAGDRHYTGTETEIRKQVAKDETEAYLAQMEVSNVSAAGLSTCGLSAEEGQSA